MKKGFTLVEILITFVIMAIVIHVTMVTLRPDRMMKNKTIQYAYTNVLENLDGIAREMVKNPGVQGQIPPGGVETRKLPTLHNPFLDGYGEGPNKDNDTNDEKFENFCTEMTEYLNANAEESHCLPADAFGKNDNSKRILETNINFTNETPNITLRNGMKVFITDKIDQNSIRPGTPNFSYYLIYVDMIGDTKFRTKEHYALSEDVKSYPEVYAFALVPSGGIVPLGLPQVEKNILPMYYQISQKSEIISYHEALQRAWGLYENLNYSSNCTYFRGNAEDIQPYYYTEPINQSLGINSNINKRMNEQNQLENIDIGLRDYRSTGDPNCIVPGFTRTEICTVKFRVNDAF